MNGNAEMSVVARVLSVAISTALILRLTGVFREWLPSVGILAALLAALHLMELARRNWPADLQASVRAHGFAFGLFALCLLAALVRVPGFASDLGQSPLDVDEQRVAASVRQFFVSGVPRHEHIEQYPGAVYWLFAGSSFAAFLGGLTGGTTPTVARMPVEAFAQASRLANIWVAVATVAVTGLVGLRVSGPAAGLIGAALVAIVPIAVETTVLVRNDAGMVLAVMAATYLALRYVDNGARAWILAAGAFAGLAAAVKFSAVFAILPVSIAALLVPGTRARTSAMALALVAFVAAVGLSNHYIWSDFPNFLQQLSEQHSFTGPEHQWSTDNPAAVYVGTLVWTGPGWAVTLLASAFAVYALASKDVKLWILISFPIAYMWFMTGRPLQVARWVYPLVPFVAVAGAVALAAGVRWVRSHADPQVSRRWPRGTAQQVIALATIAVLWQPVWAGTVSFSRRVSPQTHEVTITWLRENARPGSLLLLPRNWLDIGDAPFEIRRVRNLGAVLDQGIEQIGGCDWVVVPEPLFEHPALRQLNLLHRVDADRTFGGNLGFDYRVYEVPKVPNSPVCPDTETR